jgi:hypothetical protein
MPCVNFFTRTSAKIRMEIDEWRATKLNCVGASGNSYKVALYLNRAVERIHYGLKFAGYRIRGIVITRC